jgi:ABC-type amino acid transport substrate-binding protein
MRVTNIALAAVVAASLALVSGPLAAAEGGTMQKIKDAGTLVIGHREASRPFSFVDDDGNAVGYSIDLCQRIATAIKDELGLSTLKIDYKVLTAENRIEAVANGDVDLSCGNDTITLSRLEKVDFSNMIFITGGSLLTRGDDRVAGIGDLGGMKVSVVAGTTTEAALAERIEDNLVDAEVVKVKDHSEGFSMLSSGEVDAHAADQLVLIGLAKAADDPKAFELAPELYSYEPYGLMMPRGDADFRLVVNRALARLYRSGEISNIYGKWFGDWGGRPSQLLIAMFALNGLPE